MKRTLFAIPVLAAAVCAGIVNLRAEDWTTTDGKVYPEVKVVKTAADAVTILYRDGGALVPLIKLSPELQKRFNFDFDKAMAAAEARIEDDAASSRALNAEARVAELKRVAEAEQEAEAEATREAAKAVTSTPVAAGDPTHHSMGELVDTTHELRADVDGENHYSSYGLAKAASQMGAPADDNHYSMAGLFGSGDPIGH